jgi:hypothetical protein
MTRPLPIEEPDNDYEQERLNAQRAERRARLIAQDLGSGFHSRDMFSTKVKARR